jgi:DNA-binding GntR family transcriptional regulator
MAEKFDDIVEMGPIPEQSRARALAIAEALERDIVRHRLEPGIRLIQERLAEEYGVSRTPIREAMRILEARGLIEHKGRGRATVRLPTAEECRDLFLVRARLEAFAAERAARWISRPHLEDLKAAQELFRKSAALFETVPEADSERRSAIFEDINTANDAFHDTITDAASCPPLVDLLLELRRRTPREVSWAAMNHDSGLLQDGLYDHDKILQALSNGDSRRAADLLKRHVLSAGATIVYWLEGRGKASRQRLVRASLRSVSTYG